MTVLHIALIRRTVFVGISVGLCHLKDTSQVIGSRALLGILQLRAYRQGGTVVPGIFEVEDQLVCMVPVRLFNINIIFLVVLQREIVESRVVGQILVMTTRRSKNV